ncbi:MAG: peptide chain release factor 2 [Candidatus Saganbacteria bacterium]|nr:peptide chain release factor 2 [Candidatus Saganbacteria bacterium]
MIEDLEKLKERILKIGDFLKIEEKKKRVGALQLESGKAGLWENPVAAQKILKELKGLEREISDWEALRDECGDLLELTMVSIEEKDEDSQKEIVGEIKELKKKTSELEVRTFLSGKYDKSNAILTINAGAGGTDAQDWAEILLRMYSRWAEGKAYKLEMPEISYGEGAGLKSATLVISGQYAYGYLKTEKGIHRLVRISPFSSEGKRHTSFASVEVIPEISEEIEVEINPVDLRVDTFRASGPGGQHVNKTDSAVRLTHIPTGMVSQSQSDRSQRANRESAMKILKARLYERLLEERKEKIEELRGERREIGWGNQIRSYVFQPYTMVKDHRTKIEVGDVERVLDGDLDIFIEGILKKEK